MQMDQKNTHAEHHQWCWQKKPSRQVGLTITSLDGSASIELPEVYVIDKIAIRTLSVPHDQLQQRAHLRHL